MSDRTNSAPREPGRVGVVVDVDSSADLSNGGAELAAWWVRVRDLLIAPLVGSAEVRGWDVSVYADSRDGSIDCAEPFSEPLEEELMAALRDNRLLRLCMTHTQLDAEGVPDHGLAPARLEIDLVDDDLWRCNRLLFAIGKPLFGDRIDLAHQRLVVGLAKEAALVSRAGTGYVTVDRAGGFQSPFEERYAISPLDVALSLQTRARGYYWGNFLSRGHVDRLGGMERVLADVPAALTEVLDPKRELVYIQVTHDMNSVSREDIQPLRDYLQPVLPEVIEEGTWEGDPYELM